MNSTVSLVGLYLIGGDLKTLKMTPAEYRALREAAIAKGAVERFIAWHTGKHIILTLDPLAATEMTDIPLRKGGNFNGNRS
jgi:hypothetical protein